MADKRISQLVDRGTVANNDVVPIVVSGTVTTNKATISSIQTFMQGNLDLGVTSVGFTLTQTDGQHISVTGSPITTSGNITLNLPRATDSIRGLLDSEDFINFSNKQSTITLTTTGTSGAATLVSNTLNIPNYAQDLSGFVTLGTTQTITAQKTFSTSGGNDTLIVNHSSGSGIGVNISKAGNGEGLIVNKISGSGNAVTITGQSVFFGRISSVSGANDINLTANVSGQSNRLETTGALPLALVSSQAITLAAGGVTPQITLSTAGAVTLTGALNGTSAVFSGAASSSQFTANGNSSLGFEGLRIINASTGAAQIALNNSAQSFFVNTRTDNQFSIFNATNNSTPFLINQSTGAATFSSLGTGTVSATSGTLSTSSDSSYKVDDGFINSALEKVLKLKPRYFYWNELSGLPTDIRQLGFYAQEVNEALGEEAANTPQDENTSWGIMDRSVIAMLTKAIQEQQQQIDSLKNQMQ